MILHKNSISSHLLGCPDSLRSPSNDSTLYFVHLISRARIRFSLPRYLTVGLGFQSLEILNFEKFIKHWIFKKLGQSLRIWGQLCTPSCEVWRSGYVGIWGSGNHIEWNLLLRYTTVVAKCPRNHPVLCWVWTSNFGMPPFRIAYVQLPYFNHPSTRIITKYWNLFSQSEHSCISPLLHMLILAA